MKNYYEIIDSDIKRYEEIRKVATKQGGFYTTGCLLDCEYTINYYRLIENRICCAIKKTG